MKFFHERNLLRKLENSTTKTYQTENKNITNEIERHTIKKKHDMVEFFKQLVTWHFPFSYLILLRKQIFFNFK
jgi:hypothetical protein